VQGECIMRLSTLEKYNRSAKVPLKNARNAAAGALRNLDPKVTESRHLDAFFYQVGTIENPPYRDQAEMIEFLRENGFQVSPYLGKGHGIKEVENEIRKIEERRKQLDWLIDGAVIKIGDPEIRERMGFTEKFPRWAVAFKFEAEECVTRLKKVTWEIGRTGKLTPLAHVEPADFYGVTVRKATLNNIEDIRKKDIAEGCDVWIRRSNDVIPEITGRAGGKVDGEKEISAPERCPACGGELVRRGPNLYCMNRDQCKPQAVARIAHFASREAMDIDGVSVKTAGVLYDLCGIRVPSDLYKLTEEDLMKCDGFQEKKCANILKAIEKSKHCRLDAFIFAIGIPNVGRKTARDLAGNFGTTDRVMAATEEELKGIPDIGEIVAGSIQEFFAFEENRKMVEELLEAGVSPEWEAPQEGPWTGMTIVVTGTLESMTRKEAEELIFSKGGKAASSVSKKTSFVVAGEEAGSKLDQARSLGIPVIDENEFLSM